MYFRLADRVHLVKFLSVVAICSGLLAGGNAFAQTPTAKPTPSDTSFSVNLFQPAPGPLNFFSVEFPHIGRNMTFFVGLLASYQHRPFVFMRCTDDQECSDKDSIDAVRNLLSFDLLGSFNFLKLVQVGIAVPMTYMIGDAFVFNKTGENTGVLVSDEYRSFVVGDIRLHFKARVLGKEGKDGPALSVAVIPTLPIAGWTGMGHSEDTVNNGAYGYGGDGSVTVTAPKVVFGYKFHSLRAAANIGALWREKSKILSAELGHAIVYGAALGYSIVPKVEILAELYGNKFLTSANFNDAESAPLLFLGGGRFRIGDFVLSAAGGGGILSGIGVPLFQIVAGVAWAPEPKEIKKKGFVINENDLDGDGIDNEADNCPNESEDLDDFQDEDGCPDNDNDSDGVVDGYDSCPSDKEDKDGFRDDDGCPDLDHDEDGIKENEDKCPNEPEDFDGFEDSDGCAESDNDKDSIDDGNDYCPDEPEDLDSFEDSDGCPDMDNDNDGVPDIKDKCPTEPETLNGIKDDDGCPDGGKVLVVVTEERIDLKETILFKTGSNEIKGSTSFDILNIVAGILLGNTAVRVSIEGHTDNQGDAEKNRVLSKKRADAVKQYLVRKGVDESRLETVGWGPDQPIANNATSDGRATNRRVEFIIIRPGKIANEPEAQTTEDSSEMDFTKPEEESEEMDFTK